MNLPKIEVKLESRKRKYLINGEQVKTKSGGKLGCRPKVFLPELGIVIKFNARWKRHAHNDEEFYNKLSENDKQYFPKLICQTKDYTIHEYVPHVKAKVNSEEDWLAEHLAHKYGIGDYHIWQIGKRLDNGELVFFDYGFSG